MVVACGVTKNQFVPQHVALTLGQKAATAYLWVAYILQQVIPEGEHFVKQREARFCISRALST